MDLEKITFAKGKSYKITEPFWAELVEKRPLAVPEGAEEVFHLVLDFKESGMQFYEGQAVGIIPPGEREDGRPMKPRLYSVASDRYGEESNSDHVALTVKRSVWVNPDTGQEAYGICSDYLCRAQIGQKIPCISPSGRLMLLPSALDQDYVFIATGTGVAPIRSYLHYLNRSQSNFRGRVFVYLGYKRRSEALYCNEICDEFLKLTPSFPFHFKVAHSREQQNSQGGRLYVGDLLAQDRELWRQLAKSPQLAFFICGLKGMEIGIDKALHEMIPNYASLKELWVKEYRWNIEVY